MLKYEAFTENHLEAAVRLSQAEGWPHRYDDWALIASVSRGIAVFDDGVMVGTGLCTNYTDQARLNMIIVEERMRSLGIGRQLMERLIALAGERPVLLIATAMGVPLYEKYGFSAIGDVLQFQGAVSNPVLPEHNVRQGSLADLDEICRIDAASFGADRRDLLKRVLSAGKLYLADNGFALLRDFGRGRVLGPVAGADAAVAKDLIAAASRDCQNGFLRLDIHGEHALGAFLGEIGLQHTGGGALMLRGPRPVYREEYFSFALVSQALG